MIKRLQILTPEKVLVDFELAGLGSRFISFFIDMLIQMGIIAMIVIVLITGSVMEYFDMKVFQLDLSKINSYIIAGMLIMVFLVFFGYFIFFEMLMDGGSPGKKAMNIKVIRATGTALSFEASVLRNIMRIADFLPVFYLLGVVLIGVTDRYQRLGDMAANCVVVRVNKIKKPIVLPDMATEIDMTNADEYQRFKVEQQEYSFLKEYLKRRINNKSKEKDLRETVFLYFCRKFDINPNMTKPEELFDEILVKNKD